MASGIYQILNTTNGHCYIGQAIDLEGRKRIHFHDLRKGNHHNSHLQSAFDKYGEKVFEFIVLNHIENTDTLNFWEQYYINLLHSKYNMAKVIGAPMSGRRHSKEARDKMKKSWTPERRQEQSKRMKGRVLSEEIRRKIGQGNAGKILSEETRRKMSRSWTPERRQKQSKAFKSGSHPMQGKHHSEKSRQKISKAKKGKTYDEVYGPERATAMKQKLSELFKAYWARVRAAKKNQNAEEDES